MLPTFGKFFLLVVIITQIQISFQLNVIQKGMKSKLLSLTEDLDAKTKIEFADYLQSAMKMIPVIPGLPATLSINQVIDEFKSENLSNLGKKTGSSSQTLNLANMEYIYRDIFANKVQENMSQDELDRFMTSINKDKQNIKMSSARYLTIHLENELKKEVEKFTQHFQKLLNQLTRETINDISKRKTI